MRSDRAGSPISRSTTSIGTEQSDANAASFPRICGPWRSRQARPHRGLLSGAARCRAGPASSRAVLVGAGLVGDLCQHDGSRRLGPGRGEQALLNHFGRLEQEIAKQPRRDVGAQPDLLGQHAVFPARSTSARPVGEPRLAIAATVRTTSRSPRRTARIAGSAMARPDMASRCAGSWSWRCRRDRFRRDGAAATAAGPRPRCRRPWRDGATSPARWRPGRVMGKARRAPSIRSRRSGGRTRRRTGGHGLR